jgi:hypothetical protein
MPALSRPARHLFLVLVGLGLAAFVSGLLRHLGAPGGHPLSRPATYRVDPGGNPYRALVRPDAIYTGDFRPIFEAARARHRDPAARLYRPAELSEHSAAFVYTPFTALLVLPLARGERTLEQAANVVSWLNHGLWLVGGLLLFAVLARGRRAGAWMIALFALHYLAYYPLAKALQLTQAGVFIWFWIVVAAFLLQRARYTPAGLALALAISIKPHLVVVPLLCALTPGFPRRAWVASFAGLAATSLVSLLYAGLADCRAYLFETLPYLSAGYAYFPNQSVNGLLLRLVGREDPAVFNLAQDVAWIGFASKGFAVVVCGAALVALRRRGAASEEGRLEALALAVLAATLASPVCWIHHYALLALPFVVAARRALEQRRASALLFASWLLAGWFYDARYLRGFPAALGSGLELYGGLLLLAWFLRGGRAR